MYISINRTDKILDCIGGRVERKSANSGKLNMAKNISKLNIDAVKRLLVSNACMHLKS